MSSSSAFAYISGKIIATEKTVYCPKQLSCSLAGNLSSCKYDGNNAYWDHMWVNRNSDVEEGVYKFKNVSGTYHSDHSPGIACRYENESLGSTKPIALYTSDLANLEAYCTKESLWELKYYSDLITAICRSDSPESCPIHEASGFSIINDKNIYEVIPFGNYAFHNKLYISYEMALSYCGGEKYCVINIMGCEDKECIQSGNYVKLGIITVDMDNKLRITSINTTKSSGYTLEKLEPFNAVEVKKTRTAREVAFEISNYINSDISLSAGYSQAFNQSIVKGKKTPIYKDQLVTACEGSKECRIDINSGLVGAIMIDIENNMSVINVDSFRPSEIVIKQIGSQKIEVRYYSGLKLLAYR